MTDTHDELYMAALEEAVNPSLLERLRAQRAASKPRHFDVVIPNWGADTGGVEIIARLNRIRLAGQADKVIANLRRAVNKPNQAKAEVDAACDLLILGLEQLYARDPAVDELLPLDPDQPLKFDERTAVALGLPGVKSAREVVLAIWGGSDFAVNAASRHYVEWLEDVEIVTDAEGKG